MIGNSYGRPSAGQSGFEKSPRNGGQQNGRNAMTNRQLYGPPQTNAGESAQRLSQSQSTTNQNGNGVNGPKDSYGPPESAGRQRGTNGPSRSGLATNSVYGAPNSNDGRQDNSLPISRPLSTTYGVPQIQNGPSNSYVPPSGTDTSSRDTLNPRDVSISSSNDLNGSQFGSQNSYESSGLQPQSSYGLPNQLNANNGFVGSSASGQAAVPQDSYLPPSTSGSYDNNGGGGESDSNNRGSATNVRGQNGRGRNAAGNDNEDSENSVSNHYS